MALDDHQKPDERRYHESIELLPRAETIPAAVAPQSISDPRGVRGRVALAPLRAASIQRPRWKLGCDAFRRFGAAGLPPKADIAERCWDVP
jgi:hypothetical protein